MLPHASSAARLRGVRHRGAPDRPDSAGAVPVHEFRRIHEQRPCGSELV